MRTVSVHDDTCSRSTTPRVTFAAARTLEFVSGMSHIVAVALVREPMECAAYATVATLMQVTDYLLFYVAVVILESGSSVQ